MSCAMAELASADMCPLNRLQSRKIRRFSMPLCGNVPRYHLLAFIFSSFEFGDIRPDRDLPCVRPPPSSVSIRKF